MDESSISKTRLHDEHSGMPSKDKGNYISITQIFMKPLYVINFKAYSESIGFRGLKIARIIDKFARDYKQRVMIAVQPTDIATISKAVKIPVLAEHIDNVEPGAKTGFITLDAVTKAGATGSLVNHSEHRIKPEDIKSVVAKLKANKKISIVCARTPKEGQTLSRFKPDFVAVEPPALIGGNVSVSRARPNLISEGVKLSKVPLLVGAGVKSYEDVTKAIELGAKGVLVASGIVKARNIKSAMRKLTGF